MQGLNQKRNSTSLGGRTALPKPYGVFNFMEVEKLKQQFQTYPLSSQFIDAVIEITPNGKPSEISKFISATFMNNRIEDCSSTTFFRLSKHWDNIANQKIQIFDYNSFFRSAFTSTKYFAIATNLKSKGF